MNASMIKIERNPRMEAAITRCKSIRPKVRRIDAQTVRVSGRNASYTVRIVEPRVGLKLAECNCEAGRAGRLCYHIAAAIAAPAAAPAVISPIKPKKQIKQEDMDRAILAKPQGKAVIIDGWAV